jgi:hypothetical protein
VRRPNDDL